MFDDQTPTFWIERTSKRAFDSELVLLSETGRDSSEPAEPPSNPVAALINERLILVLATSTTALQTYCRVIYMVIILYSRENVTPFHMEIIFDANKENNC